MAQPKEIHHKRDANHDGLLTVFYGWWRYIWLDGPMILVAAMFISALHTQGEHPVIRQLVHFYQIEVGLLLILRAIKPSDRAGRGRIGMLRVLFWIAILFYCGAWMHFAPETYHAMPEQLTLTVTIVAAVYALGIIISYAETMDKVTRLLRKAGDFLHYLSEKMASRTK